MLGNEFLFKMEKKRRVDSKELFKGNFNVLLKITTTILLRLYGLLFILEELVLFVMTSKKGRRIGLL